MPQRHFMLIFEIGTDDLMAVLRTTGRVMGADRMPTSDALESTSTLSLFGHSQHRQKC